MMKYIWVIFEKADGDEWLLNMNDYKIGLIKYENKKYYVVIGEKGAEINSNLNLTWEITKNCYNTLKQILLTENNCFE